MPTIFKIKLAKIKIEKNGYFEELDELKGIDVENGLEATLVYPSPGLPAIKSIRTMKLNQNREFNYYSKDTLNQLKYLSTFLVGILLPDLDTVKLDSFIVSPQLFEFDELIDNLERFKRRKEKAQLNTLKKNVELLVQLEEFDLRNLEPKVTLFRQSIQGNSFLEVQISAVRKANEFVKFFTDIVFAGLKGAVETITGFKGITAMVTTTTGALLEIFAPKDKANIIAYGVVPIDENTPVVNPLRVNLYVPKTFMIKTPKTYDDRCRILELERIEFQKGEPNGYIEFTLERE